MADSKLADQSDPSAPHRFRAGLRVLEASDPVQKAAIPLRVLYPTLSEERAERIGPYSLSVATGAPIEGNELPLIVISHGGRATALIYRGMASYLARAGFVVALPDHPGDCRADDSLAGTAANLENRPRHIRLAIDAVLADEAVGPRISTQKIGLIGHSMGAYTALAVAGGRPHAGRHETPDGQIHPVAVSPDPRVRALVLLAPACAWYWIEGSLSGVHVPMLVMTGEKDEIAPQLGVEYIERDCDPALVERRKIAGAGHHAFQSPFPPKMTRPDFPPSQDPPGFDRAAFQPILHAEILAFLKGGFEWRV